MTQLKRKRQVKPSKNEKVIFQQQWAFPAIFSPRQSKYQECRKEGGRGGGAAGPPDFGGSEGAASRRITTCPPDFETLRHAWVPCVAPLYDSTTKISPWHFFQPMKSKLWIFSWFAVLSWIERSSDGWNFVVPSYARTPVLGKVLKWSQL